MKNINFKIVAAGIALAFGIQGCSDDDKLPVDFDAINTQGGAFATEIAAEGSTDFNRDNPFSTVFSKTYEMDSRNGGQDITKLEVFASYDGENVSIPETLYKEFSRADFETGALALPRVTVDYTSEEIINTIGLDPNDMEGGDRVDFRLAITTPDGVYSDVSPNFDNQSADHTFASTVICIPVTPYSGDYELDMQDSYGDGWNGANIAVVIDGVSTSYEPEGAGSVILVNVPDGTQSLEFIYSPGAWEEEVTFTITSPSGNTTYSDGPNPATGTLPISYCNE